MVSQGGQYGVGGFETVGKEETVIMTEEKGATMVTILDGGSKEGNLGIFETKEMQVAKNRMQEAIANIYYSIH